MPDYNFLGLVNDVNERVNEVKLTSSNFSGAIGFYSAIKNGVNAAVRDINQEEFEWPFNHETQEETLSPGTVRYFIPYDVKSLDMNSFRLKKDSNIETRKLHEISYDEYLHNYIDYDYNDTTSIRNVPEKVFRSKGLEYGVIPTPDKEYTVEYEYYRLPTDMRLWSDVPTIPEQFRYVILEGAMYHAYAFRGEENLAQLSQVNFRKGIDNMRTIYINHYKDVRDTRVTRYAPRNNGYYRS